MDSKTKYLHSFSMIFMKDTTPKPIIAPKTWINDDKSMHSRTKYTVILNIGRIIRHIDCERPELESEASKYQV